MRINLPDPGPFARFLLCCVAALHALNLSANYLYHGLELRNLIPGFAWWATFVNVDKERNLPTWFSTTLLMLATYVLWEIAKDSRAKGERYAGHWRMLSLVFAFLSMDEISQMHEMSRKIGVLQLGKASYLSWIVVAAPLVLAFCVVYLRFLLRLPRRMRLLIAGGGVLFMLGAVGMEIVGAFVGRGGGGKATPGVAYMEYLLAASAEELFEMLGVVAFLHAISTHLHERQQLAVPVPAPAPAPTRRPRPRPEPAGSGHGIALERGDRPPSSRAGVSLGADLLRPEFFLEYQPIVRLADRVPVGFEALLRWSDPARARHLPGRLPEVDEETAVIASLRNRVLAQAVAAAAAWPAPAAGPLPHVSVDVSRRQFHTAGFVEHVLHSLAQAGLAPDRLTLGITETLLADDDERVWRDLAELRREGVRVAVGFGAGHCALDNLHRTPIDVLKLDRIFTGSVTTSPYQAELVAGIIALAHQTRLDTIAEGVGRQAELDHLLRAGCPYGQGRLFARPMSDRQVRYWIGHHGPAPAPH